MNQPRSELGKWGMMETDRMMQLHIHITKGKTKTPPKEGMIILDQNAAREYLGL